jgi:hypothetical protein
MLSLSLMLIEYLGYRLAEKCQCCHSHEELNMRDVFVRRMGVLLAVGLAVAFLPAAGSAAASAKPAPNRRPVPGARLDLGRARIGRPVVGKIPAAPSHLPSKAQQIKVLKAALTKMRKHYKKLASEFEPGPSDVFDYNVGALWRKGIDGAGTTVAVIEGWNFPGVRKDLAFFDKALGLPTPDISTIYPSGDHKLPKKCPPGMVALGSYGSCSAWGGELLLDVLSVHLMAPYAKIIISVTPADSEITDDAASNVAPPEMMEALEAIGRHHLANVISISDGQAESTFSHGPEEITSNTPGELAAAAAGIPVLVGTGDCDVVQALPEKNSPCDKVTAGPSTAMWDDSPWITAMGGTVPNFSATGVRLGSDPVWNLSDFGEDIGVGEGAGYSSIFARPGYQNGVASITKSDMRSVPDLAMDSSDGTSEAGPLMNGVLALATQLNHHHNVGPINPVLYRVLGPAGTKDGIVDVVNGNDTYINGSTTVTGFTAGPGFDVATGWGTINAARFVPALVHATRAAHEDVAVRAQARHDLSALEHRNISLTVHNIGAGGTSTMTATDFLPGHPVVLHIDGKMIATLTASSTGVVTYVINPSALGLSAGRHVIKLTSMLLTETARFRSS